MQLRKNKVKKIFKSRKVNYGIWNGIVDTYAGEICAGAGFDWVLIDGEHAPFDLRSTIVQMQIMEKYDTGVIVRPPTGDPVLIKQLLDAGAQTLLIPMVDTVEQAEQLVAAMRYPPNGIRGVGTALARAAQWNRVPDYLLKAEKELCLIVQVESTQGMENIDAISKVKGVDGVFIGPADLSASMGYIGQSNQKKVKAEVKRGIKIISKNGKVPGVMAIDEKLIKEYVKAGAEMMGVAIDSFMLAQATTKLASSFDKD